MFAMCSNGRTYIVDGQNGHDIQAAIDKAFADGGGKVVVPVGKYNVGSIQLKSNVELHLEKGAVLIGSDKEEAYFSFPEEICSIRPEESDKVLIYAFDSQNISITGDGLVDGRGHVFFDTTKFSNGYFAKPQHKRPRMVQFVNCDGVRLEGVCFKDSPCWTMLIRLCQNVNIEGISVTADQRMINNDGIDIDGCRHVRVSNSCFKTGDDCIILRAMKERADQNVVCEDVIVSNCSLDSRCQAVRLGCPSDDVIRNARFNNIQACGNNGIFADFPVRYLDEGDTGQIRLTDIVFDGFYGEFDGSALQIVAEPGVLTKDVSGLVFRNFNVKSQYKMRFIGNPGSEIGSVLLENFNAIVSKSKSPYKVSDCNGLVFKNVVINGEVFP